MFFPIFWMVLTSFKTEIDAIATPPKLFFTPTLENYAEVRERADYFHFALNSVLDLGRRDRCSPSLIAVPAAYAMAFFPTQADQGPPAVDAVDQDDAGGRRAGADLPVCPRHRRCSTPAAGLIIVYTLMNLPIVVWMLYTFFKEVPKEILEAGRMDGAQAEAGGLDAAAAAVAAGHRLDRAAVDHPVLERGVLEPQPHGLERRAR